LSELVSYFVGTQHVQFAIRFEYLWIVVSTSKSGQRDVLLATRVHVVPLRIQVRLAQQGNRSHQGIRVILRRRTFFERKCSSCFVQQDDFVLALISQCYQRGRTA